MKILLSAYECAPDKGSEYGLSWNWAIDYAESGVEVWCLTSIRGQSSIEKEISENNIPTNLHFIFVQVPQWIEQNYQKKFGIWVYVHYWAWLYKCYSISKKLCQQINFNLVHHVSWGSIQQGTLLWRLNKPLIFGPVGGGQFPPSGFRKYFLEGWSTEVRRKWTSKLFISCNYHTRKTLKKASLTLVVNQETATMAQKLGARNVQLFIDGSLSKQGLLKEFPDRATQKILRILWVGRFLYRKGLPLVLESLSQVSPEVKFRLTLLGDGPAGKYLPQMLTDYHLEDKVDWKGFVPLEEVKVAYLEHDLFFFCPLRESNAVQFLEAMSYGLPVLTLNLHGSKVIVPDNAGIKITPTHPQETVKKIAKAIEYLYHHRDEGKAYGKNGYDFAKKILERNKVEVIKHHFPEHF